MATTAVSVGGGGGHGARFQPPAEYVAAVDRFRAAQAEMARAVQVQAQCQAQFNETKLVVEALKDLKEGETVYKQVGKLMVRQEVDEARANVARRMAFIEKELGKAEVAIKAAQDKMLASRKAIAELQAAYAKEAGAGATSA